MPAFVNIFPLKLVKKLHPVCHGWSLLHPSQRNLHVAGANSCHGILLFTPFNYPLHSSTFIPCGIHFQVHWWIVYLYSPAFANINGYRTKWNDIKWLTQGIRRRSRMRGKHWRDSIKYQEHCSCENQNNSWNQAWTMFQLMPVHFFQSLHGSPCK